MPTRWVRLRRALPGAPERSLGGPRKVERGTPQLTGIGGGIPATRPVNRSGVAVQTVILIQRRANRYAQFGLPRNLVL